MEDFGISEDKLSLVTETRSHFVVGSIVVVVNGARPFPAVITKCINDTTVEIKYYEFDGEFNISISRLELLHPGLLTKEDIEVGFAGLCLFGEDQQYHDAVVTKITEYGVQVFYTQSGESEEVPIAYLKRKPKKSAAEPKKFIAKRVDDDSLNSSFQPEPEEAPQRTEVSNKAKSKKKSTQSTGTSAVQPTATHISAPAVQSTPELAAEIVPIPDVIPPAAPTPALDDEVELAPKPGLKSAKSGKQKKVTMSTREPEVIQDKSLVDIRVAAVQPDRSIKSASRAEVEPVLSTRFRLEDESDTKNESIVTPSVAIEPSNEVPLLEIGDGNKNGEESNIAHEDDQSTSTIVDDHATIGLTEVDTTQLLKKKSTFRALKKALTFKFKRNRFADWTREELIMLLISINVQVREECDVPMVLLMDECDRRFRGRLMPTKPTKPTDGELLTMKSAALVIQNFWFRHRNKILMFLDHYEQYCMENTYGDEDDDMDLEDEEIELGDIDELIDHMTSAENAELLDDGEENIGDLMYENDLDTGADDEAQGTARARSRRGLQTGVMSRRDIDGGDIEMGLGPSIGGSPPKRIAAPKVLDALDVQWKPPDFEIARKSLDYWHPRKGAKHGTREPFDWYRTTTGRHCILDGCGEQCDLWGEGMMSEFSPYGAGITNYFKFLKWLYWVFAVLAIIALPELVVNLFGAASGQSTNLNSLGATTVGNLANTIINGTVSVIIPGCDRRLFGDDACELNRASLGTFYTSIDLAVSIFLLVAFGWLFYFERREERDQLKKSYYASQFTVQVRNLPDEFREHELEEYFVNLALGDNKYSIHSIHLAHENEEEIANCRVRGDLLRDRTRMMHEFRYQVTRIRGEGSKADVMEKKVKKKKLEYLKQLKAADLKIREMDSAIANVSANVGKPLVAYVTFEERIGAMLAIDRHTTTLLGCLRKRPTFKGRYLDVREAPEPAKIIWENLGYGAWQRGGRRLLTIILAMLLVLISVIITYGANVLKQASVNSGGSGLCPGDFETLSLAQQEAMVDENPSLVHCYCDQFSYQAQSKDDICKHYLRDTVKAEVLTFFSSVVVLIVSTLIEYAIRKFAEYEKHHTQDSKEKSICLRLFIMQYLNTSCVFLINNNKYILETVFQVSSKATTEFSASWYNSVGVTIILVQLGSIVINQSSSIYNYLWYHANIKRHQASSALALTQSELNRIHIGPDFELSYRYAQLSSTFFVCLTFSSGIPILYAIAAVNFYVAYLTDKFLFVHLCREPVPYSAAMGKEVTMLIPIGIALHLGMSVWMLSNKEIFSADANQQISQYAHSSNKILHVILEKITYKQTVPLFILCCAIVALYICFHLFKNIREYSDICQQFLLGNVNVKKKIEVLQYVRDEGVLETFSGLVYTNKMKGLTSYNILQNPDYKEAFGITWNFAFKHQKVKSVFNFKAELDLKVIEKDDDMTKYKRMINRQAREREKVHSVLAVLPTTIQEDHGRDRRHSGQHDSIGRHAPNLERIKSEMLRQQLVLGEIKRDDVEADEDEDEDAQGSDAAVEKDDRSVDNSV